MRLLTWNIHKGIGGVDRRYRPERIIAVLRHYDPDVCVLQEVDEGVPRSRGDRQPRLLAEALDFPHRAFGANVRLKHGHYGNATLSRFPISRCSRLDLTFPLKKPRGALVTELSVPVDGHRFRVHLINTHLGLAGVERRWQVRKLLRSGTLAHLDRRSRIILAGDMNDWAGSLPPGRLADEGFHCVTGRGAAAHRTFPAWAAVGALDKVFVKGPLSATRILRSRLRLAAEASDHLPLVVDIELLHE